MVSKALGGGKTDKTAPPADVKVVETWGELVSAFAATGGTIG